MIRTLKEDNPHKVRHGFLTGSAAKGSRRLEDLSLQVSGLGFGFRVSYDLGVQRE